MEIRDVPEKATLSERLADVVGWYANEGGPSYHRVPSELVAHDFFDGIELNISAFVKFMDTGRMPTAHDLRPVTELAMARLANGAGLPEVIGSYQKVSADLWRRFVSDTDPSERDSVLELMPKVTEYIFNVVTLIATEAARRSADPRSEARERERAAVDALLATGQASGSLDIDHPKFVIAVFHLSGSPGQSTAVSALKSRIESIDDVHLRLDSKGWVVVHWSDRSEQEVVAEFRARLDDAQQESQVHCWAGIASAKTASAVPDAYRIARGLASTAYRLNYPDFVADLAHSTVEYLVGASGPDLPAVADLVAPLLAADPIFEQTLRIYLDESCNQLATARRMHVHRNSVTYRLSKVHALTGLDPMTFVQAASLHAALIARDLS
ncbi:PucR family transcriptional regulator [Rhodococcus sp. B7740]|uniref:PucR family transcriptional regulator n=1 Tax=Rhodococcus sp. B7740 TaxID=1564114 RepID=UPI0011855BFB|nr:helix-turn-helix domain-containing protein [Rhodococcus sp. B7740]